MFIRGQEKNKKKKRLNQSLQFRGERGIRTPGTLLYNGFQDRRIRPLCHFSAAKIQFFLSKQDVLQKFYFYLQAKDYQQFTKPQTIILCE